MTWTPGKLALAVLLLALGIATGCRPAPSSAPPPEATSSQASSQPAVATGAATSAPAADPVSTPSAPVAVPGGLKQIHDPGQVTGTLTGPCHMTGAYPDQLPDPRCTPGSIDPAVTQANIHQTICVRNYTKTVRPPKSETSRFKFDEAYPAYGLPPSTRTELDHQVSLELGGSNDASNLWPEQPPTPNPKDEVESDLHSAVCSGAVTLATAQNAITANWTTATQVLGIRS